MNSWINMGVSIIMLSFVACNVSSNFQTTHPKTNTPIVAKPTISKYKLQLINQGKHLADFEGCTACHSIDGRQLIGPTWRGLHGSTVTMNDGTSVIVNDTYIAKSISMPEDKLVEGYLNVMPIFELDEEDVQALIEYIKTLE